MILKINEFATINTDNEVLNIFINCVSFIFLFIVVFVLIGFITKTFNNELLNKSLSKLTNHLLGFLYGLIIFLISFFLLYHYLLNEIINKNDNIIIKYNIDFFEMFFLETENLINDPNEESQENTNELI